MNNSPMVVGGRRGTGFICTFSTSQHYHEMHSVVRVHQFVEFYFSTIRQMQAVGLDEFGIWNKLFFSLFVISNMHTLQCTVVGISSEITYLN